jgi:hypothetical protein
MVDLGARAVELHEMDEMKAQVLAEEKVNEKTPDLPAFQSSEGTADRPPEYCHYRDEGCTLSVSCLNCPFPNCIYEEPGGRQRWLKKIRAKEMARLFTTKGKSVKELALIFGVSQRTVQRALKVAGPRLVGEERSAK